MRFTKYLFPSSWILIGAFWGCSFEQKQSSPEPAWELQKMVGKSELNSSPDRRLILLDGEPFTGIAVTCYPEGDYAEQIAYLNGKRNGFLKRWYPNGLLSQVTWYTDNKRDGKSLSWWGNGLRKSVAEFRSDTLHGTVRQWYKNGRLFKMLRYENGNASGLQQAWRENGVLYANYEIINGRSYGLRKSNLCFQLQEEEIVRSDVYASGDSSRGM